MTLIKTLLKLNCTTSTIPQVKTPSASIRNFLMKVKRTMSTLGMVGSVSDKQEVCYEVMQPWRQLRPEIKARPPVRVNVLTPWGVLCRRVRINLGTSRENRQGHVALQALCGQGHPIVFKNKLGNVNKPTKPMFRANYY